jgi:3-dehydroquinate dehydratase
MEEYSNLVDEINKAFSQYKKINAIIINPTYYFRIVEEGGSLAILDGILKIHKIELITDVSVEKFKFIED